MSDPTLSMIGGVLLLVTASIDYYHKRRNSEELPLDIDSVEDSEGEIDYNQLPYVGSPGFQGLDKRILLGYLLAILVEVVGLLIYFEVL